MAERLAPSRASLPRALVAALALSALSGAHAAVLGAPELSWHDAEGHAAIAKALSLSLHSQVAGLVAETTVTETFRNDGKLFLEGQYRLPLPEGAAVHDLKLTIGGRTIEGEIREKQQAQAEYQQAAANGQHASLVEAERGNLFRTAVANVAPGETVVVTISWSQPVVYHDDRFELALPLAQTTPYSQQLTIGTPDTGTPALTGESANVLPADTEVTVDLWPGLPTAAVGSDTHQIVVQPNAGHYAIRVTDARAGGSKDFALQWTPAKGGAPQAASFVEQRSDGDYAMTMLLAPEQPKQRIARELILVIDTSGSMTGASITQAKAALGMALDHLQPGDRFNVIEFNSVTRPLFPTPVEVGPDTLDRARAWVGKLQAEGGTEMLPALDAALAGQAPPGYLRQVVFATDGEVDQEDGLYVLIEDHIAAARLFTIGIGDAPNARFLDRAAAMGRGTATVIRRIEDVGARMGELFDKLDRPALTDLTLDFPALSETFPKRLPDLYHGEPLMVVSKLAAGHGTIQARGLIGPANWAKAVSLDSAPRLSGIARLWAKQKVDALEYRIGRDATEETIKPEIVALATEHHLVTRFTSLIAVDKTPVRPSDAPLAGMGDADTVALAKGATPKPLLFLIGCLGLMVMLRARMLRT